MRRGSRSLRAHRRRDHERALQYVRVMRRGVTPGGRTPGMAQNVKYIIDHERPGTKFVLWAFDGHLAHRSENDSTERTIGRSVREVYGAQYYAVVTTAFNQGSYQTRVILPSQLAVSI